jgi:uncharacterized protein YndB with AHSA1/START domain
VQRSTRSSRQINAPRDAVYRALLDATLIEQWRAPDGMSCHVHEFDAREGGGFRVSLTYDVPSGTSSGKTDARTDTYKGRFIRLVTDSLVVESVEFETSDPDLVGQMTISTTLEDAGERRTDILVVHDGIPRGVSLTDNDTGTRMSLARLAALVEAD